MAAADPIVREIYVEAAPTTVFPFFTDADKLTRWLAVEATLDARPGGECLQMHDPEDGSGRRFHMRGTFVEVMAPDRVVFTWGFDEPDAQVAPGSTTVEVTLSAEGSGTRVRLVHHDLPPEAIASHSEGWTTMLERLARATAAAPGATNTVPRNEGES